MKTRIIILIALAAMILGGRIYPLHASEGITIYRLPFRVVCPDQPEMIQAGIEAFLSSRLSSDSCMPTVVPASSPDLPPDGAPTPDQALAFLQKSNGNYLIYGTVVRFGDTLTTDAFLYDRIEQKIRIHFHDMGTGDGALLDHLTRFSGQVTRLLGSPCYSELQAPEPVTTTSSDHVPLVSQSVWKSPPLSHETTGITVCDLDSDGSMELVAAHENSLTVYTLTARQLNPKATFQLPRQLHIVGLDSCDIDRNGKPEIYVSAIREDRHTIGSMILEWSGASFDTLQADLPWLFRSQNRPEDNTTLILAQKNASLSSLLGSPIAPFDFKAFGEASPPPVPTPSPDISLFSFTSASDTLGQRFATYAFNHRIRVYDTTMALQWESEDDFGGSDRFMAMDDPHDPDRQLRVFLEPRLTFVDVDHDGINELISIKNKETANNLFSGFRHFSNGQVVIFKRTDFGYSPSFETEKITGHIVDYTIRDTDADGKPELVYAVTQPGKGIFSSKNAFIIVQKWDIR